MSALAPLGPTLWFQRRISQLLIPVVAVACGAVADAALGSDSIYFYLGCMAATLTAATYGRHPKYWIVWLNTAAVMAGYLATQPIGKLESPFAVLYLAIASPLALVLMLVAMEKLFSAMYPDA